MSTDGVVRGTLCTFFLWSVNHGTVDSLPFLLGGGHQVTFCPQRRSSCPRRGLEGTLPSLHVLGDVTWPWSLSARKHPRRLWSYLGGVAPTCKCLALQALTGQPSVTARTLFALHSLGSPEGNDDNATAAADGLLRQTTVK